MSGRHPVSTITDPRQIVDYFLRVTGQCLLNGDAATFASCFKLPQTMETMDGEQLIDTPDRLAQTFKSIHAYFRSLSVTDISRTCLAAEFLSPTRIAATYESRLLRGTELLAHPYPNFCLYEKEGEAWQIVHTKYAITEDPLHNAALLGYVASKVSGRTKP